MQHVLYELRRWLEERNVPTDSLTVILNWQDERAAAHFDAEMRRSIEPLLRPSVANLDIRQFDMVGIKVRVESPLHDPHGIAFPNGRVVKD